jgi:hypothetical protein
MPGGTTFLLRKDGRYRLPPRWGHAALTRVAREGTIGDVPDSVAFFLQLDNGLSRPFHSSLVQGPPAIPESVPTNDMDGSTHQHEWNTIKEACHSPQDHEARSRCYLLRDGGMRVKVCSWRQFSTDRPPAPPAMMYIGTRGR